VQVPAVKPRHDLLILDYPWAVRILAAASHVDLELQRIPDPLVDARELAVVRVGVGDVAHDVLVDNEYGDADSGHRALLLALVLTAFADYGDGATFETWQQRNFTTDDAPRLRQLFAALPAARAAFAERFAALTPPGEYEWSVNSDGARALREVAKGAC